jgi:hypothetical protein
MKHLLLLAVIIGVLINCSRNNDVAGTADDVNSGSIFGMLLTEEEPIDDTVTVSLYSDNDTADGLSKVRAESDTALKTIVSYDGTYNFDSLAAGDYRVEVIKDSIVVGEKRGITLKRGQEKEVNITIVIIINQTFNIWTDESQNITINNFYIDNGSIVKSDSGYVLTSAESDTIVFKIEIEKDGDTSIITVRIIRHEDGSTTFEIIDGEDDIDVTITAGSGPAEGYLGDITIDVKELGTTEIESTFDTSGVPEKSK